MYSPVSTVYSFILDSWNLLRVDLKCSHHPKKWSLCEVMGVFNFTVVREFHNIYMSNHVVHPQLVQCYLPIKLDKKPPNCPFPWPFAFWENALKGRKSFCQGSAMMQTKRRSVEMCFSVLSLLIFLDLLSTASSKRFLCTEAGKRNHGRPGKRIWAKSFGKYQRGCLS